MSEVWLLKTPNIAYLNIKINGILIITLSILDILIFNKALKIRSTVWKII